VDALFSSVAALSGVRWRRQAFIWRSAAAQQQSLAEAPLLLLLPSTLISKRCPPVDLPPDPGTEEGRECSNYELRDPPQDRVRLLDARGNPFQTAIHTFCEAFDLVRSGARLPVHLRVDSLRVSPPPGRGRQEDENRQQSLTHELPLPGPTGWPLLKSGERGVQNPVLTSRLLRITKGSPPCGLPLPTRARDHSRIRQRSTQTVNSTRVGRRVLHQRRNGAGS